MFDYKKAAGVSFFLAVICWVLSAVVASATPKIWIALFAIAFSIVFLCFLIITISKKICPRLSAYRIFILTNVVIGLAVLGYALYDMISDTGWFAGIKGMLLLIFVVPIHILLLIISFFVWKFQKRKNSKQQLLVYWLLAIINKKSVHAVFYNTCGFSLGSV